MSFLERPETLWAINRIYNKGHVRTIAWLRTLRFGDRISRAFGLMATEFEIRIDSPKFGDRPFAARNAK